MKVGDKVRIIKKFEPISECMFWVKQMDKTIGMIGTINYISSSNTIYNIDIGNYLWNYHKESLELVNENILVKNQYQII